MRRMVPIVAVIAGLALAMQFLLGPEKTAEATKGPVATGNVIPQGLTVSEVAGFIEQTERQYRQLPKLNCPDPVVAEDLAGAYEEYLRSLRWLHLVLKHAPMTNIELGAMGQALAKQGALKEATDQCIQKAIPTRQ